MKLSQKTLYAIRALIQLSDAPSGTPLAVATLAKQGAIPTQFLQVIFRTLRTGGFVESRRGKDGGYILARSPDSILLGEVIRFLEGDLAPVDYKDAAIDPADPLMLVWRDAEAAINAVYNKYTLAELAARKRIHSQEGAGDFSI